MYVPHKLFSAFANVFRTLQSCMFSRFYVEQNKEGYAKLRIGSNTASIQISATLPLSEGDDGFRGEIADNGYCRVCETLDYDIIQVNKEHEKWMLFDGIDSMSKDVLSISRLKHTTFLKFRELDFDVEMDVVDAEFRTEDILAAVLAAHSAGYTTLRVKMGAYGHLPALLLKSAHCTSPSSGDALRAQIIAVDN